MEWLVTLPQANVSAARQNRPDGILQDDPDQQLLVASQQSVTNANLYNDGNDHHVNDEGLDVLPPSTQRRLELGFDPDSSTLQAASNIVIVDAWVADLAKPMTVVYKKASESVSEDVASNPSGPGYWQFMRAYFEDLRLTIEAVQAKPASRRKAGGNADVDISGNEDLSAALNSAKAKLKCLEARETPPNDDRLWMMAPIFCLGWFRKEVSWWKAVERGLSEISSWFEPSLRHLARSTECPVTFGDATAVIAAVVSARGSDIEPVCLAPAISSAFVSN